MDLVYIDSIPVMYIQANGQMGKAMDVEFILAKMAVDMLENSNGVLNMVLAITVSGKQSHYLIS